MVITRKLQMQARGNTDIQNITVQVAQMLFLSVGQCQQDAKGAISFRHIR
jgi:hypothetical protein